MDELMNVTTPEEGALDLDALGAEMEEAGESADMGDLAEFATAEETAEAAPAEAAEEAAEETVAPKSDDYLKTFANSFSSEFVLLPPKDYNFKQAKADQVARDKEIERRESQNKI